MTERQLASVLEVGQGALMEKVNIELEKIAENLYDPNVMQEKTRELTVKFTFNIDKNLEVVTASAAPGTPKLSPQKPVEATLVFGHDENGWTGFELTREVPGQMDMNNVAVKPPLQFAVGANNGGIEP